MKLHGNAGLSLNNRRKLIRRILEEQWSPARAAAAGDVQATAAALEEVGKEFAKADQADKELGGIDACNG